MNKDKNQACFDIILPGELNLVAREKALQENPANVSAFEAASVKSKLWSPGKNLTVCFLDGIPEVQAKVEQYAHQWEKYANLRFQFTDDPNSIIRISFKYAGSWSAVGTDALVEEYFPKNEPTMNYGWLLPETDEEGYSSVVLHEFGHAIGMIHEHMSPTQKIKWNKEAVYAALGGPPNKWDRDKVNRNMFDRYSVAQTQFTEFDPKSIMIYSIPEEWTTDGTSYPDNNVLSENDKKFIAARYPKSST